MVIKNLLIVVIGLAGLTIGTYTSLSEIICEFFIECDSKHESWTLVEEEEEAAAEQNTKIINV